MKPPTESVVYDWKKNTLIIKVTKTPFMVSEGRVEQGLREKLFETLNK